jgi:hypothetical protein
MKDPEIDSCLEEIARARENLGRAVRRLQDRTPFNPLDWGDWVGRYPVRSVLGAAVIGFYLSRPGRESEDGRSGTLLDDLTRAGLDSLLPVLIRTLL